MAQITHNVSTPNDGLGDNLREGFIHQNAMNTELYTDKVDKAIGKDLSANDFTDLEKSKLAGIEPLAQVNLPINYADLIGAPIINSIAAYPDARFNYVNSNSFNLPPNVQAISVRKNGNPTEFLTTNWTQTADLVTYLGILEVGDYLIINGVYVIGSTTGGGGSANLNVESYRSEYLNNVLYVGYLLESIIYIYRVENEVKQFAINLTNLEIDWTNKINLQYN